MATVVNKQDLPGNQTSRQFEGYLHGAVNISFFLSDTPPGRGPSLHTHPYAEVFVVQEGKLTFTVGDETIEAVAGQVVIAPPGVPHGFINSGSEIARHIDIHVNERMVTAWLDSSS